MISSKGAVNDIISAHKATGVTPLKVAVTGGIAGGKSRAAHILQMLGAHVIDADIISREITEPGSTAYRMIAEEFGAGVLKSDETLDRAKLRALVFNSPEKLSKLNSITHPIIAGELEKQMKTSPEKIVFALVPLLIETALISRFDIIWSISASEEVRIKRLIARDNISRELAESMIAAQIPESIRNESAHTIIYNEGSVDDFDRAVREEYFALTGMI